MRMRCTFAFAHLSPVHFCFYSYFFVSLASHCRACSQGCSVMTYKRRKNVRGDGHLKKSWRTKRRTKDLDEIDEDIKDENAKKLLNQDVDLDKPGAAQHYCVHCAKYFINPRALEDHFKTKVHKRRLKALEAEPYTIEESERAAGHGNWIAAKKRKIETLTPESFEEMRADEPETPKSKVLRLGE